MPISIKNADVEQLVRVVAAEAGESLTDAVRRALEERLERLRGSSRAPTSFESIMEVSRRCCALPDLDARTPDEVLGYDEHGTFGRHGMVVDTSALVAKGRHRAGLNLGDCCPYALERSTRARNRARQEGAGPCGIRRGRELRHPALKAWGATVATTCSTRNVDLCCELGADFVIDYTKQKRGPSF